MSYLEDMEDPPVPKLVSTVPLNKRRIYPGVARFEESMDTVRIYARLEGFQVVLHFPRDQWDDELDRADPRWYPGMTAQRLLNRAFDKALQR